MNVGIGDICAFARLALSRRVFSFPVTGTPDMDNDALKGSGI